MTTQTLDAFIADVTSLVDSIDDEHRLTSLVAERLSACWPVATGCRRSSPDRRASAT
jgi:hypothetical protein